MYDYNCPDCNEAKLQSDKNARKINEIIGQVNQIIDNDIATTEYLLEKVDKIVDEVTEKKMNNISSTLNNKADKDEVFSMANMGQDIKEAMVGGSVPVTGVYSVDTVNLVKNSVTKNKTDFLTTNIKNLLNLANSEITNVNYSTGVKPDYICDDTSLICNTNADEWLYFFIKLNLEVGKTYTCTLKNTNINKDMNIGITYENQPTTPTIFTFINNNGEYKLTFKCESVTNYIKIHAINGGINIKDIFLYEGTENVVWTLDKNINIDNINDGIVSYNKLTSDLQNLFYKFDDILNINVAEFLVGSNVESYNQHLDSFDVKFNEGPSYFVFKGQQFKNGHKYVITYNVVGDVDYRFGIRSSKIGYASWIATMFESNSQTGGAYTIGTCIYNCNEDSCLGFNNSCGLNVSYNVTIRVFDVTDLSDEEINKIDFLSLGLSNTIVKNNSISNNDTFNNLKDKKIVFYGDSICQNGYFQNMIKNYFQCNVVTNAIGGTTIAYFGSNSFSNDERIKQLPSDADYVMIMGGTNDWNKVNIGTIDFSSSSIDRTTIKGGLLYAIKGIQEQCPNAIIIVCTAIGGRGTSGTSTHLYPLVDQFGQSTLDIRNATIEVANIANVDVCDTWSCGINGFNRNKYIADSVHPNTEGNKLIGNYIINFLKKYN